MGRMECAGYRIPLFLDGEDSLENMEVSDMEVYWDMTDQLWEAVKDLPEGTKIGNVSFEQGESPQTGMRPLNGDLSEVLDDLGLRYFEGNANSLRAGQVFMKAGA